MSAHSDPLNTIFGPPMSRSRKALSHVTFTLRHPLKALTAWVAAIPAVRRHVLFTTSISDHPMYPVVRRGATKNPRYSGGKVR